MTVFQNQNPNLVLASPVGSTGQPDFRALTKSDLPSGVPTAILANTVQINVTNTFVAANAYVLNTLVAANTVANGDIIKITYAGNLSNAYGGGPPFGDDIIPEVRVLIYYGANGNSSDPIIFKSKILNEYNVIALVNTFGLSGDLYLVFNGTGNTAPLSLMFGVTSVPTINVSTTSTAIPSISSNTVDTTTNNYIGFGMEMYVSDVGNFGANGTLNVVTTIIS